MESKKKIGEPNVAKKVSVIKALTKEQIEQKVREVAYFKWQAAGRPNGRDVEFWKAAEVEVAKG